MIVVPFYLWWRETMLKGEKNSICFVAGCSPIFCIVFLGSLLLLLILLLLLLLLLLSLLSLLILLLHWTDYSCKIFKPSFKITGNFFWIWRQQSLFELITVMHEIPKFYLISWCGNFVKKHSFCRISGKNHKILGDPSDTLRKLCVSTQFSAGN